MSRIRRNMEDSGKHRFHSLEHDSKMRLFKTYSHTSTLRGYEASGKMLKQKTTNEERKTGKGLQKRMAGSTAARAITFRRLARGMKLEGTEKGKRELCTKKRKKITKCENAGVGGRIPKNLASKPRDKTPSFGHW